MTTERVGDELVVELGGEVDLAAAPELAQTLADCRDCARIVVDLAGVTFLDSSALNVVARAHRAATEGKAPDLVVRRLPDQTRQLFAITGLDTILKIES